MKLTKAVCKIVGVRVGEIEINLLGPLQIKASFVLLRNPQESEGINAGQYTKDRDFSSKTMEAFQAFIDALEDEVLVELFQVKDVRLEELDVTPEERETKKDADDSLSFPTLGGEKGTPQF